MTHNCEEKSPSCAATRSVGLDGPRRPVLNREITGSNPVRATQEIKFDHVALLAGAIIFSW